MHCIQPIDFLKYAYVIQISSFEFRTLIVTLSNAYIYVLHHHPHIQLYYSRNMTGGEKTFTNALRMYARTKRCARSSSSVRVRATAPRSSQSDRPSVRPFAYDRPETVHPFARATRIPWLKHFLGFFVCVLFRSLVSRWFCTLRLRLRVCLAEYCWPPRRACTKPILLAIVRLRMMRLARIVCVR